MVEFGLVAPIFFILLFGVMEIGHYIFVNHQVANAAREGARWAVVRGPNSEDEQFSQAGVEAAILSRISGLNPDNLTITVDPADPGGASIGTIVTVEVTYQYQPLIGMVLGTGSMIMTHSSEMAIQY